MTQRSGWHKPALNLKIRSYASSKQLKRPKVQCCHMLDILHINSVESRDIADTHSFQISFCSPLLKYRITLSQTYTPFVPEQGSQQAGHGI